MRKSLKIAGITISITWLALLMMALWAKAVSIKFDDFFVRYVEIIFWSSSVILLILIVLGIISLRSLVSTSKSSVGLD